MNKLAPKVSIIMATYNRGDLIVESLDSILNQSFRNWECLIIDDGCSDNTEEILKPFLLADSRIKYSKRLQGFNKGLPGCRNQGLEFAKGDYIIFFDDDDIVHPDNLKLCIKELENSKVDFCRYQRNTFCGDFNLEFNFNPNYEKEILDIRDLDGIISGHIPFNSCQVMWKKNCFAEAKFNESLMYAEEWELYIRILAEGKIGISIDKVLFYGRKHPNSNTGEFFNNDPVRRASNLAAIFLVLDNLAKKDLLTPKLERYFIRTAFALKEISVLNAILIHSNAGGLKRIKYLMGFKIYPFLKQFFYLKAKIKL